MTTIVITVALIFLACVTFWLNRNHLRLLRRWHLHHASSLPYHQMIEIILLGVQFCLILACFLLLNVGKSEINFTLFLGQLNWNWRFFLFLLLYLLALIEVTMFVLIGLLEVVFKVDSRVIFQKMAWLAFSKQQPLLSFALILLITLTDAILYFGILNLFFRKMSLNLPIVVLSFSVVKACSFKGNLERMAALLLFLNIGIWCMVATIVYGWLVGALLLGLTYMMISFKEQHR